MISSRVEEFRTHMAARERFPASRRNEFCRLSAAEVWEAVTNTRAVAERLEGLARRSRRRRQRLAGLFQKLDIGLISCDHRWREIIAGLNRVGPEYDECRRLALAAYLEYLRSREAELEHIYREKADTPSRLMPA
jgi:hypothetical protein